MSEDFTGGEVSQEPSVTPEAAVEPSTPEVVNLQDASDADIDAFLANYPMEVEEEGEEVSKPEPKTPPAPQPKPTEGEAKDTEDSKKVARMSRKELEAKYFQSKEALAKQTLAYQRRSSEYGEAKKALQEANRRLAEGQEDRYLENPDEAIERKLQIRRNEEHIQQIDAESATLAMRQENMEAVAHHIPEDEFNLEAMAKSLSRDGATPEMINAFMHDPYSATNKVALIQLAKRAHVETVLSGVVDYARTLQRQVEELKAQPRKVIENIQQASKTRTMSAASGGASRGPVAIDNTNLATMSDAELEEIIRQARRG